MIDLDGNKADTETPGVGEISIHGKQRSGVIGCDRAHSNAHIEEDRSTVFPSRIYWLKEWQEARGKLQHIDLTEGSLTFQGFIVRIPASLSADLANIQSHIGQDISILRTDSTNRIIVRAGD